MPETLAEMIAPVRTALVVVDVQVDFCAVGGALGRAGVDLAMVEPAIDRIEALIAVARASGATVCFLRCITTPETDSAALETWYARRGMAGEQGICRVGDRGCDYYRLSPQTDDIEIEKLLYSGFHGTDLDARLKARGVDTLVMTGFTTECCVDNTARDGFHHGYHVFVVADACGAYEPALHDGPLDVLAKTCALVVDSDAVTAAWAGATTR
jgi:nicotinamidase-related amidase